MTLEITQSQSDRALVCHVLEQAGARGASHEDFVEAGLARDYITTLRALVDRDGLDIRTDFTTGQARWALVPRAADATRRLRVA